MLDSAQVSSVITCLSILPTPTALLYHSPNYLLLPASHLTLGLAHNRQVRKNVESIVRPYYLCLADWRNLILFNRD